MEKVIPKWVFVVDLNSCIGCNACMVACAQENQTPYWSEKWRTKVEQIEIGEFPQVKRVFFPHLCMQCQNTPCLYACPTGATYKTEEGIVLVNYERCIGCEACVIACPYDARYPYDSEDVEECKKLYGEEAIHTTPHIDKCTWCYHRIKEGLVPACVETCPTNCRMFGDLNEDSYVSRLVLEGKAVPLSPHLGTEPKVFYVTSKETPTGDISHHHGEPPYRKTI
jgi:Fe-S-cluster-containing dehydrogenase component